MTITEQLQFSVLTTPVAALDRRALSQAWYSALYGSTGARSEKHFSGPLREIAGARTACGVPAATASASLEGARSRAGSVASRAQIEGTTPDRRAPRSALARKIERAFLRPRAARGKASFTIEGDGGRVHVLLRSQGTRLKLIAICPPKSRSQVASALAQARYALALRGIDLDADARSQGC
jgi:hypothetical protein